MRPLNIAVAIAVCFLLLFAAGRIINSKIEQGSFIDITGRLVYTDRGEAEFTNEPLEDKAGYKLEKIMYKSKGTDMHAHLYRPHIDNAPAVIIAPAAGAAKEGQKGLAEFLAGNGYAVLAIDQRGIGETQYTPRDAQTEFDEYMQQKKETTEQLMVYDVLRAFDVMSQTEGIDKSNIILEGESMGGRFAMIATAIEPRIKGIVVISSSGYGIVTGPMKEYIDTVNPDNYVHLISPRKLLMFHSATDTVVPPEMAKATYELAKEPKELIGMPPECIHGYCDQIRDQLLKTLEEIRNSA